MPRSLTPYRLKWADHVLDFGVRTWIMGILNVTPDSFSDGGKFFDLDAAVSQGIKLVEEGADLLDIGGESTRPFSESVSADEESRRVIPVIEKLAAHASIPISIDTTKAVVAKRAIEAGASIINDVSALRFEPGLAAVAKKYNTPLVLMHMLGNPKTMQIEPHYDDVVAEVLGFLEDAVKRAMELGIERTKLIVDPGIGFGKTVAHNLLLIRRLHALHALNLPVLIGPSRKMFIRRILQQSDQADISADLPIVQTGTQAAVAAAALNGAHIVRVHEVGQTRATLKIVDAIRNVEAEH